MTLIALVQSFDPGAWGGLLQTSLHDLSHAPFWLDVLQIIFINVLLSGDNAVIIAMACRGLPRRERLWGLVIGAGVAVVLRIIFAVVITQLLLLPYLKVAGGLALIYIAVKLLIPTDPAKDEVEAAAHLWRAVRIVVVADIVMSLDNIIAVAAVARGDFALLAIGLVFSIPLVIAGAALTSTLFGRFPILIWAGAALLGWVGGETIASDPAILRATTSAFGEKIAGQIAPAAGCAGVALVIAAGGLWRRRRAKASAGPPRAQADA
jgi:YjbE family integral membrane protein